MTAETLKNPVVWGRRFRHRKGSTYTVIATGFIEATMTPCVVYEADLNGLVFVRPLDEFMDGRFTCIDDEGETWGGDE